MVVFKFLPREVICQRFMGDSESDSKSEGSKLNSLEFKFNLNSKAMLTAEAEIATNRLR